MHALAGHSEAALRTLERALPLAERLQLPDVFVESLTSKAVVLTYHGRLSEARILLEAAVARSHEEQLYASALRAMNNLGVVHQSADRYAEALEVSKQSLELARRRGDRRWESNSRTGDIELLYMVGRWEEALTVAAEEEPLAEAMSARSSLTATALVHSERGDATAARALLAANDVVRNSDQLQVRASYDSLDARVLRAEGRASEALSAAKRVLDHHPELAVNELVVKRALVEGVEAAFELSDLEGAEELLRIPESLYPGELTPFLQASTLRLRARLDSLRGHADGVDDRFVSAAALFREFRHGLPPRRHGARARRVARCPRADRDEAEPRLAEARDDLRAAGSGAVARAPPRPRRSLSLSRSRAARRAGSRRCP